MAKLLLSRSHIVTKPDRPDPPMQPAACLTACPPRDHRWISPMYDWSSASIQSAGSTSADAVRSLYQRSLSFVLVSMDENGLPTGRRRLLSIDSADPAGVMREVSMPKTMTREQFDGGAGRGLLQVGAGPPQTTGFGLKTGVNTAVFNEQINPLERIMQMTNMQAQNTLTLKGAVIIPKNEACQNPIDLHRTMQDKARTKLSMFTTATSVLVASVNIDPLEQAQACSTGRRLLQASNNVTVDELEGSITLFFTFSGMDTKRTFDVLKAFDEIGLIKLVDEGTGRASVQTINSSGKGWFYDSTTKKQWSYTVLDKQPDTILEYSDRRNNQTLVMMITIGVLVVALIGIGVCAWVQRKGDPVSTDEGEV